MDHGGWVIYRHPRTALWYARPAATLIVEAGVISQVHTNDSAITNALSGVSQASMTPPARHW
jgi:hypothetical protein